MSVYTEVPRPPLFSSVMPGLRLLHDSTSLTTAFTCGQKYLRQMIQGHGRGASGKHLVFGKAFHAGHEGLHNARWQGHGDEQAMNAAIEAALRATGWREADGSWQRWISTDKKKNPSVLVRSLVWYADDLARGEGGEIATVSIPGREGEVRPATEVWWQAKLPFTAVTGEDYWLCGLVDRVVEWDDAKWPLEVKTTGGAMEDQYWQGWFPNIQIKTYDLGLSMAHPEWDCAGVLLEAHQVGVGFSRWARTPFRYASTTREQWLDQIGIKLREIERWHAQADRPTVGATIAFPDNYTACHGFGDGCPLRPVCRRPWAERDQLLGGGLTAGPWDPRMR